EISDRDAFLHRIADEGIRAWPALRVPARVFASYLAHTFEHQPLAKIVLVAHAQRGPDLLLAFACAKRLPAAARGFRDRYDTLIRKTLRQLKIPSTLAEDAHAMVYRDVLVGRESPEIAKYTGVGELGQWLRTVVRRVAIHLAGVERKNVPVEHDTFE